MSCELFVAEITEIENRITPTGIAKHLGFKVERGRIICPYHSGGKRTMRCSDGEKAFWCQTENCKANRSKIGIIEFYSRVKGIDIKEAISELRALEISPEPQCAAPLTKGFINPSELLEFYKASHVGLQCKSQHVWYNPENLPQKVVFRFEGNEENSEPSQELILHGFYYRGKWFRTRLQAAGDPLPYNWPINANGRRLIICRNEAEADYIQGLGFSAIALSSVGIWDGTHRALFRSLDITVLYNPDTDGAKYRDLARRDLVGMTKELRLIKLPRLERTRPTAEHLSWILAATDIANHPWEKPLLRLSEFDAIPFFDPEQMLPESIRYHLLNLSEDLQCPVDMLAAPAITGLSVLVGRKLTIQPKAQSMDFRVAAPLWCILIADPGQKKTQILKSALAPLFAIEEAIAKQNEAGAALLAAEMKRIAVKERDLDGKFARAVKSGNQMLQSQLLEGLAALEVEKASLAAVGRKQLVLRDSTPEKMLEILVQNPNGLLQFADEVPGWWRSLGTSYLDMRKLFLEGWGGFKIHVQRKSYSLCGDSILSVVGGAQPAWLDSILADLRKGRENDGLIHRFSVLINHEPTMAPWRYVDCEANPEARQRYHSIFERFHSLSTGDIIAGWKPGDLNAIRFSREAQELFVAWMTEKENAIREGRFSQLLASHVSKYTTLFSSLALIFHLILYFEGKTERSDEISLHATSFARKWCEYLFHHALRTFSQVKPYPLPVRAIACLISNGGIKDSSPVSALQNGNYLHLQDPKQIRNALHFLVDKKLIRLHGSGVDERIYVNPHALYRSPGS